MWLKVPTQEKSVRKFWVEEDPTSKKLPVRIIVGNGTELRLTLEEADDLCKQLGFLFMDQHFRGAEK